MTFENKSKVNDLCVSLIQADITWHKPKLNLEFINKAIVSISHTDVIVLPEMWLTGFTMKAQLYYKDAEMGQLAMEKWSIEREALIIGSLIVKEKDIYYNRAFIYSNGVLLATYDKRHLFALSGENRYYNAGHKKCIIDYKGWRLNINICYDLRFPVWSKNTDSSDVLIYLANWPDKRILAWNSLLPARAIENQSYVLGVNCFGIDAWKNIYSGHSQIIQYDGLKLAYLKNETGILTHILSKKNLSNFRIDFPFLKDQDNFEIKI